MINGDRLFPLILQFANKTSEDVKMLRRIDEVAALMEALENLPEGNPLKDDPAYQAVAKRRYVRVPRPDHASGPGFWASGPAIFRPRQLNSVRTKAANRPSWRCNRRGPFFPAFDVSIPQVSAARNFIGCD